MKKIIAFDADDTLFANEPYFEEAEQKFCTLMQSYLSHKDISMALYHTQIKNLPLYGYGIKGYMLSMVEAALDISNHTISTKTIEKITQIGKELLQKPVELLEGVHETLEILKPQFRLVVATKGDLKDQHRKLHDSGLGHFFHHIEVMVDKHTLDYEKMIGRLDMEATELLMIGNSLKSDVLPVLEMGGTAIHVPYHTTWLHEQIDHAIVHPNFYEVKNIRDILPIVHQWAKN